MMMFQVTIFLVNFRHVPKIFITDTGDVNCYSYIKPVQSGGPRTIIIAKVSLVGRALAWGF